MTQGATPPTKLIEDDLPVLGNRHLVTLYLKPAGYGVTAVAIILDDQHAMMMRKPHPRPPAPRGAGRRRVTQRE